MFTFQSCKFLNDKIKLPSAKLFFFEFGNCSLLRQLLQYFNFFIINQTFAAETIQQRKKSQEINFCYKFILEQGGYRTKSSSCLFCRDVFTLEKVDFTTKIRSHLRSDHPELVGKFDEICSEFHMKSIDSPESVNDKGQLILKCSFGFIQIYHKTNEFFLKGFPIL